MGLTLVLNADLENYYCSSTSSYGFKILLHSPIELPRMRSFGFAVQTGQETRVVIKPLISDASDSIRTVPVDKRQCVFENESKLKLFKIYSRKNCEMECVADLLQENCDCVLYYMPKMEGSKICNKKKAVCYDNVLYSIASTENQNLSCICLPSCFEVVYEKEISSARLGAGNFQMSEEIVMGKKADFLQKNVAVVHVYFQEKVFRSFTKGELIGFTEFLSNTGGLLGLFLGFSVISLVELIYFLSIRPYCAVRRLMKERDVEEVRRGTLGTINWNNWKELKTGEEGKARKVWEILKGKFGRDRDIADHPYPYYD
jgi:amiloride-sensitive sodium channel